MESYPYRDIPDLVAFLEACPDKQRAGRLLRWNETREILRDLNVSVGRRVYRNADLVQLVRENLLLRTCDCHVPEGLRWHKVDNGDPVTWSVNLVGAPDLGFNYLTAIRMAFNLYWPMHSNIKFKQVDSGLGDIHISWSEQDGIGGTLGFAYMPATGDRMNVAQWAGDIFIDMAERFSLWEFITILAHEIGHAIGINHIDVRGNLMYPSFLGIMRLLGKLDIKENQRRYGVPATLNVGIS